MPPPPPPVSDAPAEDALPVFLTEDEVDVPARPLAPIRPAYPEEARARGAEGDVVLRVFVRADGRVAGLQTLESDGDGFAREGARAVRGVAFAAGRREGGVVNSSVTLRVRFRLD